MTTAKEKVSLFTYEKDIPKSITLFHNDDIVLYDQVYYNIQKTSTEFGVAFS